MAPRAALWASWLHLASREGALSDAADNASAAGIVTTLEVVELFPGRRRDRELFVGVPFSIARSFPSWRPGIRKLSADVVNPRKNPLWQRRRAWFFAALRDGRAVGRMALIEPGSIPQRPRAAVLAFPDFIDDGQVVRALVEAVCARARAEGATELIGPMNPDIHHDIGIQVAGFEHPNAIFMGYQPPYYAPRLESAGLRPFLDAQAWSLHEHTFLRGGPLSRLAKRAERRTALRIRTADIRRFDQELEVLFHLYSEAFTDHWGFERPTWEEFTFIASDLRHILRQNLVLIAEWNGEPVGFVVSIPDLYEILPSSPAGRLTLPLVLRMLRRWRTVGLVRVMIAGVLPSHRHLGIHAPLFHRIATEIFDLGFRGGEISWVVRDNEAMTKALTLLGARVTKTYRLYIRDLS